MSLDKYQQAWKSEASRLDVTFDREMLTSQVQRSHDQFRSLIFWRDVREIGVSLLLIPIWFAMGFGMSLPWTWWLTIPALLWIAVFMFVDRKRHSQTPSDPGEPLLFYAQEALIQVEHQIWLLRNVFWWYLLPFVLSLSAFFIHNAWNITGTWWGCLLVATPFGLFLFYLYRWIYRLNQKAVEQQLLPRQQHLQQIVTNLESDEGGDAAAIDDLVELVSSLHETDKHVCPNASSLSWAANWNRIIPTWRMAAMIFAPTLVAGFCGYQFALDQAGPVFFQSVVSAVVLFEIMFFGRCYYVAKRAQPEPLMPANMERLGAPAGFVLVLLLVVSALALAAVYSFVSSANSDAKQHTEQVGVSSSPVFADGYAKVAPFTDVRWHRELPVVCVDRNWFDLKSIDGIPIEDILSFCHQHYGSLSRKRFAEDLVQVLSEMGHDPAWEVDLGLKNAENQFDTVRVRMTLVNRRLVRFHAKLRADYQQNDD